MPVTAQQLIDGASDLADMVNDPHVATATWLRWANRGTQKLWRKLLPVFQGYFWGSSDFTLTSGNTLTLASTDVVVLGVTRDPATTRPMTLHRYNNDERDGVTRLSYAVVGNVIEVRPAQYAAGSYRYYSVSTPTTLTVVGSTIDTVFEPFAEFLETYMAIKALAKEESDTTDLRQELDGLWMEIEAIAAVRNATAGEAIVDADRTGGDPWLVRP